MHFLRFVRRVLAFPVLIAATVATSCFDTASIVARSPAGASEDSVRHMARDVVDRVAQRHALATYECNASKSPRGEQYEWCFSRQTFFLFGRVQRVEVQVEMYQSMTTRFAPWADSIVVDLSASLRAAFGDSLVRVKS